MKTQSNRWQTWSLPVALGVAAIAILVACLAIATLLAQPFLKDDDLVVTIHSPQPGERIVAGERTLLVATAIGAQDIARLELYLDDEPLGSASSPDAEGSTSLTISEWWTFSEPGSHTVTGTAYTRREKASSPVAVDVVVLAQEPPPTPTATPTVQVLETPQITPSSVDTAQPTATPVPTVTSTATTTPSPTPTNTATPTPSPTATLSPTPSATPTNALPNIEYFRINPETIAAGECALLEWGAVTNAYEAIIDQEIGGVATPGSMDICPSETTSYVLTANGLGGTVTSAVIVTVITTAPNLVIDSIDFAPDPPVQGQDNEVKITIQNTGGADTGPFSWEWQPGVETPIGGRVLDGLRAGQSHVGTAVWRPSDAYSSLLTVARVDIGDEVGEVNESDNELQTSTQVIQSSLGDLVLQEFYLNSDDLVIIRVSNPGGRITDPSFDYQLYQDGALVTSGSFDMPGTGSMDFWTDFVVVGEHSIRVVLDPANIIAESDENNNEGTLTCSSSSRSCW
jgi:hypothetical protein